MGSSSNFRNLAAAFCAGFWLRLVLLLLAACMQVPILVSHASAHPGVILEVPSVGKREEVVPGLSFVTVESG